MTEEDKKKAICDAAEGKIIGVLCLNVYTMRCQAQVMRDAAKAYAKDNQ